MARRGNESTKCRRFSVDVKDDHYQELLCAVARDEGAVIERRSVWGVTFECEKKTAKTILQRAGHLAAQLEALRDQVLTTVFEQASLAGDAYDARSRERQFAEDDFIEWNVEESEAVAAGAGIGDDAC